MSVVKIDDNLHRRLKLQVIRDSISLQRNITLREISEKYLWDGLKRNEIKYENNKETEGAVKETSE